MASLAGIEGLALVVTLRGRQRPLGTAWRDPIEVPPLSPMDGRKLFLAVAGRRFADDPRLEQLLAAQDGMPLAIELLAYAAEGEPDLAGIWRRWTEERGDLLRRHLGADRELSTAAAFEVSINGPRMTGAALRLLSLLGSLPNGIAHHDLATIFPGVDEAAASLRKVGLAFDEAGCLRMLQPVRDHVQRHHPPSAGDLTRAVLHYVRLARELGPVVRREGGQAAASRLAAEGANLEATLRTCLGWADPRPGIKATLELSDFLIFSGLNPSLVFDAARAVAESLGETVLEAELRCRLGDVAFFHSEYAVARGHYEQALPLFEQDGDVRGLASCIASLGDVGLVLAEYANAKSRYEQGLTLSLQAGDLKGQAACYGRLGELMLHQEQYANARTYLEYGATLFEQVGDVHGQATCIACLGCVALTNPDDTLAMVLFEQALSLFEKVDGILGRANCIARLGDVALARIDLPAARSCYRRALALYVRIADPYLVGATHMRLAFIAATARTRAKHLATAHAVWDSIDRAGLSSDLPDLIDELISHLDELAARAAGQGDIVNKLPELIHKLAA